MFKIAIAVTITKQGKITKIGLTRCNCDCKVRRGTRTELHFKAALLSLKLLLSAGRNISSKKWLCDLFFNRL